MSDTPDINLKIFGSIKKEYKKGFFISPSAFTASRLKSLED